MDVQRRLKELEDKSLGFEKRSKEFSVYQRDLLTCRAELARCRTELFDCKEELTTCRGDLASCHEQIDEHKEKLKEMERKLEEIQSRIRELEKRPTYQEDWMVSQKLKSNDRRMDRLQKEIDYVKETTERLDKLQHLFKMSILTSQLSPQESLQATQSDGAQSSPDTEEHLTVASGVQHGDGGGCRAKGLENSWCYVVLSHHSPLPRRTGTQLIHIGNIHEPSTPFNRHTATFKARHRGLFGIHVWFGQRGDGKIDVWIDGTSERFGDCIEHIASTTSDRSSASKTLVRPMEEGDECWVNAKAQEGKPGVWWCRFSIFLLSGY